MPYILHSITIHMGKHTQHSAVIAEIWSDIESGRIPLLFDNELNFVPGISPILQYSDYSKDDAEEYALSFIGVTSNFFRELEKKVQNGFYKKYDFCSKNLDLIACSEKAWEIVRTDQETGKINRAYTCDYESTVPAAYTKDGKVHSYLYIAINL